MPGRCPGRSQQPCRYNRAISKVYIWSWEQRHFTHCALVRYMVALRWASRYSLDLQLTEEISAPLSGGTPLGDQAAHVPPSPATPATPAQLHTVASPSRGGLQLKSTAQPAAKTTLRATFKIAIAPPDTLQPVPEFELDGEGGTPLSLIHISEPTRPY